MSKRRFEKPDQIAIGAQILIVSDNCGGWNDGIFSPEYDYYLHPTEGNSPSVDEWRLFFSSICSHNEERWKIEGIKKFLRTEEHRKLLYDMDLSIEEFLRGDYLDSDQENVDKICANWNEKLGFQAFGS